MTLTQPLRAAIAATLLAAASLATAQTYLLDTGPGPSGDFLGGPSLFSSDNGSYQHLAVSFEVTQASVIGSVAGWIAVMPQSAGALDISLHLGMPYDALIYSGTLTPAVSSAPTWVGLTGLNWAVDPGYYTLSFTAQPGLEAFVTEAAERPASTYWTHSDHMSGWTYNPFSSWGARVATVSAVPEPATWALWMAGALAVAPLMRRRQLGAPR